MNQSNTYQQMIDDLLDLEEGLNDWEVEFVDSISQQTYLLTARQRDKLVRVWNERILNAE